MASADLSGRVEKVVGYPPLMQHGQIEELPRHVPKVCTHPETSRASGPGCTSRWRAVWVHHPVAPSRRHTQEHDGRFGELRSLRWRDVDFVNANIHVRLNLPAHGTVEKMPKGKRVRPLPLWDQAARPFDALSQRGYPTGPDDLVFVGTTGGHLDYRTVKDEFYATLERAGFGHLRQQRAPFTFHDLRHSFGTLAVQVYPVTDVQVYMGHEKIETTMRYVHFVPKVDAAAKGAAFIAAQMENVSPLCPEPTSSDPTERNSEHLTTA